MTFSPLATRAAHLALGHGRRQRVVGLAVHTTGSGVLDHADDAHEDPIAWTVRYYGGAPFHPHYVGGWRGELVAVCDEDAIAYHVGLDADRGDVALLRAGGGWDTRIPRADLWRAAWAPLGVRAPADLMTYGGRVSANAFFLGLELIPLRPAARAGGLWFSPEQHELVARLAADVFARYALAPSRRALLGHEDLNPLDRWDAGGGWDPGARRERPRFDWQAVYSRLGL